MVKSRGKSTTEFQWKGRTMRQDTRLPPPPALDFVWEGQLWAYSRGRKSLFCLWQRRKKKKEEEEEGEEKGRSRRREEKELHWEG